MSSDLFPSGTGCVLTIYAVMAAIPVLLLGVLIGWLVL